jgi:hypothetical protein
MSDTRVDLYLEWEQALNEPEVDSTVVAGLETKARDMGIDLWQINNIMLNGLTAASFDPNLHPRGRDGKFIETLGFVRLFDFVDKKGTRHSEASGRVKSIKPDERNPGNPNVEVTLDDGSSVVVKPSQVASGPATKARLSNREIQEFEGRSDSIAVAERARFREESGETEDRPFKNLSDEKLEQAYRTTVDRLTGDIDPQLLESLELDVEYFREEFDRRGLPRTPRKLDPEGDILDQYKAGVLYSRTGADDYGREAASLMSDDELTEAIAWKEQKVADNLGLSSVADLSVLQREQERRGGSEVGGDRPFENLSDAELQKNYADTVERLVGDIDDPQLVESLGLDVEYFHDEFKARGLTRGEAGDRPFRDLSDDELRQTYQNTVDAALGDIDPQLVESLGLDAEYLREEMESRGLPRREAPAPRPPGPRAFGEEGDLEPAFESGVPTSIRDAYFAYQAAERDRGVQDRDLLDLDDWVESGSPAGGAQAPEQPGPVREKFERTNYVESRDVGNLMVGDEIILPGDMPGVVESFEFPGDRPDSVIVHTDNGTYHGKTGDVLPSYRDGDNDINQIGEPVTVEPGELGSKDNPIKTADPLEAVTALHEGKYVELETVDQVSTLLDELARIANEAKEAGEKAPNYDLCLVSVPNTNLFCAESKGIPRIEMPQLGGVPTPGSRADSLPKNDAGEVDIGPAFVRHLREKGVNVEESRKMASHLKASQSELVGTKVGGMMKWMEGGTDLANNTIRESSIFVTRDGYVVDGHHRWAAVVGLDAQEGGLDELDMPVREIDMDILDVLKEANDFAIDFGVPPKGTGAPGAAPGVAV